VMSKSSTVSRPPRQQGLLASPSQNENLDDSTKHCFHSVGLGNSRDLYHI
jgi:hypothetical protein